MVTARPKIAMLCGSVREGFSGTQDFAERLSERLSGMFDTIWIDQPDWRARDSVALDRSIGGEAPDVVLMHYPTDAFRFGFAPHLFALLSRRAPLVVTLHEFSAGHPLRKLSVAAITLRAKAVVVTTESEKTALLAWFPWLRRRIYIVPIASNIPEREWRKPDRFTVSFFGQIRPLKGVEFFLDCARLAAEAGLPWRFRLFGSVVKQNRGYFAEIAPVVEAAGIELSLDASGEEVADGLAHSSAALLEYPDGATLRRGSLLAAAGCGTPIATRHSPETPAFVAENTLSIDSPAQALAALRRLADDDAMLQDLHDRAIRIKASTSWDATQSAYARLLSNASIGAPPDPERDAPAQM